MAVLFGRLFACLADGTESENRRVIARRLSQSFHVLGD